MKRARTLIMAYAWTLLTLLLVSWVASGINTITCTSYYSNELYNETYSNMREANDELNDYWNGGDNSHIFYSQGRYGAELIMAYQEYIPQHFVINTHGSLTQAGRMIWVGKSSAESLYAFHWRDNIHRADKMGWKYSATPFSDIVFGACNAGGYLQGESTDFWVNLFTTGFDGYIFWGPQEPLGVKDSHKVFHNYYNHICDDSYSYGKAVDAIKGDCPNLDYADKYHAVTDGLAHSPANDKYRSIHRSIKDVPKEVLEGENTILEYDRSNYNKQTTNGAFVIAHGVINGDKYDLNDPSSIALTFEKWVPGVGWVSGGPEQSYSSAYAIQNRNCYLHGHNAYGGSDIITRYLTADYMRNLGSGKIQVTLTFDSYTASKIILDRFEIIEIRS